MPRLCRTPVRNESLQFMREWSSNRSRSCAASVCQRRSVRQSLTALQRRVRPFAWQRFAVRALKLELEPMLFAGCWYGLCLLTAVVLMGYSLSRCNFAEYERLREQGRSRTPVCTSANYVQIVNMWHPFAAKLRGRGEGGGVGKQRGGALEANCCANS